MADYFLDSSALVKRYVSETGSVWITGLFDPALNNEIFIAGITSVEIVAALTRRTRGGTITPADAAMACRLFRTDLRSDYQVVEINEALLNDAMTLAETYGLRGYDAVQLAAGCQVNRLCIGNGLPPILF